ncbi:MAG: ABC transporter, partial [Clostridia bacterium]|nr:ABC transporter [Clostridia bacterium]
MSVLSEIYHEHIDYRKQTLKMAKTDLVRTYRGSALGWSWAVIKPVITIFIYWFAMSMGLRHG